MTTPAFPSFAELEDDPLGVYEALVEALRSAHRRSWSHPEGTDAGLLLPADLQERTRRVTHEIPRRFGSTAASVWNMQTFAPEIPRSAGPVGPGPAHLVSQTAYVRTIEGLVVELAARVAPWFGRPPTRLDWIVTEGGGPRVFDLGYWLDTAGWSTDVALEDAEIDTPFEPDPELPAPWSAFIAFAVQWEIAARGGLLVPRTYKPPKVIADAPFSNLPNPFVPALELWRCGVLLEATFREDAPVVLYVDATALAGGISTDGE